MSNTFNGRLLFAVQYATRQQLSKTMTIDFVILASSILAAILLIVHRYEIPAGPFAIIALIECFSVALAAYLLATRKSERRLHKR